MTPSPLPLLLSLCTCGAEEEGVWVFQVGVHLIGQGDLGMGTGGEHLAVCNGEVRIYVIKQESK